MRSALIVASCCAAAGLLLLMAGLLAIDFDFTKMTPPRLETVAHTVEQPFSAIHIEGLDCDVTIQPAENGVCRVESPQGNKILTGVAVENGTLTVTRQDGRVWYEYIGIWRSEDYRLTVYLPQTEYTTLYLETISGDVRVPEGFTFGEVELKSTSGDVSFEAVAVGLSVKNTSGDIYAANVSAGPVRVTTTSGDVRLETMVAEEATVSTTSGDIKLATVTAQKAMTLTAVSGDIELERVDAGELYFKTVSGDIEGTLLTPKEFVADTVSGVIGWKGDLHQVGAPRCVIHTTSGDVRLAPAP